MKWLVLLMALLAGCTFVRYDYGDYSVFVQLGERTVKVDATNDLKAQLKDLIPAAKHTAAAASLVPESSDKVPGIEIKYNVPEQDKKMH